MSTASAGATSQRSLLKGVLKGSSLYSIALLGQRAAGIFLIPITTRFLLPSDYGVSDLLEQVATVISILLGINFSAAVGYFYFAVDSEEARRKVVGTTVGGAALLGLVALALCWPFAGLMSRMVFGSAMAVFYLHVLFLTLTPGFLLEALFSWLRVENRTVVFVAGSWLRVAATIVGTVVLIAVLRLRVLGVLYTSGIAIVVTALVLGVYCFRVARPSFDPALLWRMMRFAAPLGLSGLALFVIHFGDRFILPHYRPFAELGIYAIAYKIGMLISLLYSSFHNYWSMQVYHIVRREDASTVMARTFTYLTLAISFAGVALIVGSRPGLRLLTTPAYHGAAAVVPILVTAYVIRALGDFFRCLFLAAGKPGYDAACNWIGAAVCVAAYFTFIPRYGIWGAAIATLVTFVLVGVISCVWAYQVSPYAIESGRLLKVAVAAVAPVTAYLLVPVSSLPAQMVWSALLLSSFPLALWLLGFPTPGEVELAVRVVKSLPGRVARLR
jgi:O-antigen/teichoic acid export membrane protein